MGFVEIEESVEAFGDIDQLSDIGAIAIHAEDGFRQDETGLAGLPLGRQEFFQMIEVVVAITGFAHPGDPAAVVDAGMI